MKFGPGEISWCVMDADQKGFVCSRCGQIHKFTMPISIYAFCKISEAFMELHKDCKEKKL